MAVELLMYLLYSQCQSAVSSSASKWLLSSVSSHTLELWDCVLLQSTLGYLTTIRDKILLLRCTCVAIEHDSRWGRHICASFSVASSVKNGSEDGAGQASAQAVESWVCTHVAGLHWGLYHCLITAILSFFS